MVTIQSDIPEPGALTVPAFCKWAGVSPAWTWRLIAEGKLGSVKRGKRRLIPMADARAWLEAGREAA